MVKFCKSIFFIVSVMFLISCGGGSKESGQLTGVLDRPSYKGINPYGMVYVGSGSITVGQSDQDIASSYIQRPRTISVVGFYMDETEITNNEYRQFTNWVKDSMAHTYLDNIIDRIDLQIEAYGKDKNIPQKLFDIYKEQRQELVALKDKYGAVVTPKQLEE